eukprot:CAMPEP_0197072618 /NCGR_PEP_ID=MMETSP1384-20130603/210185_1 /TAXON_ID=29189 /ORGANISM="Ammonia sp." /LENGTH=730 /DNA_ID=CAMNT_0042511439 /DNA_START=29 /DNA_END=2220 /DNA_ORIENTATION=-
MSAPAQQPTIALISASCVASRKFDAVNTAFCNNDNFKVMQSKQIMLNEEQQQSLPIDNVGKFCNSSIAAYLLQSDTEIDFQAIERDSKLSKSDIFKTSDAFFVAKLKQIIFPQKAALEQTLIVCEPAISAQHATEIEEELKMKGVFVLFADQIASSSIHAEQKQEEDTKCTAILCESYGCIDSLTLMVGCADLELCAQFAPTAWINRYKESNYTFLQISDAAKIESIIPKLSAERTLALIKPAAVSKGYAEDIINEITQNGFTIISQKRVHLKIEHAQHFYKEHQGKPFFDELTSFMSSGPIYAFILERIGAIKCWRTLLGPTNTFKAKESAPQSIRARYGTDQTANACHGSDSPQSAQREIRFYFPEIGLTSTEISTKMANSDTNIVEQYMSQKLGNDETLKEFLIRGLSELAKEKPGSKLEVVEWFGHWLLDHNPNKPSVQEPNDVNFDQMSFVEHCKYVNGDDHNPNKPSVQEPNDVNFDQMSFVEHCKYVNGDKDLQIVFVLGGPGSGKGTQCQRIVEKYGFIQISTGDLFRRVVSDETNMLGAQIKQIMAEGKLVPTELVLNMLKEEIVNLKGDKYLLDGFPRSLEQAIMFEKELVACKVAINFACSDEILTERCLKDMLKEEIVNLKGDKYLLDGFPRSLEQAIMFEKELVACKVAINFACSDEILTERCLKRAETSGRVDDNKETIQKRLGTFHEETDPTVEYLKSMKKVKEIDATRDVEAVW